MKQFLFFFFALIALSSCRHIKGSGNIVTEKRQTGNFKGISVGGSYEVEVKTGPVIEVLVESDDNIMRYIQTKVEGDVLKISIKGAAGFTDAHLKVYITTPQINSIKSSGAANIKSKDLLTNNGRISFEASGASEIKAQVDAPEIYTEISGAASIELTGRTKNHNAEASGSGDLKTGQLLSESTDVTVSGAASAHVYSSVSLTANASGAASINYRGAGNVKKNVSGAASIKAEE